MQENCQKYYSRTNITLIQDSYHSSLVQMQLRPTDFYMVLLGTSWKTFY